MATPTIEQIQEILNQAAWQQTEFRRAMDALKARHEETAADLVALKSRQEETAEQMKATDELIKANAVSQKETSETVDKIGQQLGDLGNNVGDASEEFFHRGCERTMEIAGIPVGTLFKNQVATAKVGGKQVSVEFDIVGVNGDSAIAVEVKHKAHPDKVGELVADKVAAMKRLYPDHKIYFALATMASSDGLKEAARDAGIFLLTQGGENIKIVNDQVRAF